MLRRRRSISAGRRDFVEHPEPGMPTLPAEIFEKVQALAPGSLIARSSRLFDPNAGSMPESGNHRADGRCLSLLSKCRRLNR